jgi:hypothetical protein
MQYSHRRILHFHKNSVLISPQATYIDRATAADGRGSVGFSGDPQRH